MTQPPTTGGSSVPSGAGSNAGFPQRPVSLDGPETVINPERRGRRPDQTTGHPLSGSSLWTRLFPPEAPVEYDVHSSPVGCRLGHFLIEAAIGSGGMGAVFRAVDERLDRVVALKVLSPSLSHDEGSVQRFTNEARAAARLDHDNIARVHYVGEDQGLHFIAHEFVTGRNLRDMIRDQGPLDSREAVNYTLQIATALRHTAAAGVVHRDIKPSNIIVDSRGRAKLVDLGLAKKVASESFGDLTIAGTTLGTFDYISPEQAKDPRNVDVRSDIYSLGCTVFHMLTGEPPYREGTVLQKLLDHQAKDVPDPSLKNPRVSPRLSLVVRRMMAADPRERYATPDDLILDLLPLAAELGLRGVNPEGLVWTSEPVQQGSLIERNFAWIAVAAVLVLIAILFPKQTRVMRGPNDGVPAVAQQRTGAPSEDAKSDARTTEPRAKDNPTPSLAAAPSGPATPGPASSPAAKSTGGRIPFRIDLPELEDPFGGIPPPIISSASTVKPGASREGREPAGTEATPPSGQASSAPAASAEELGTEVPRADSGAGRANAKSPDAGALAFPEISITETGAQKAYATLEAAVADAKDGGSIELKFNGPRPAFEKPFRVSNKRITIRGAKGFRPVISFAREVSAAGFESRMMTLNNGGIELVDVDILANVPESGSSDHWALFSLGGADRLRLRGVNVTVTNPGNRQADMVDVASSRDQLAERIALRQTGPMGAAQEFEVEIDHCFIRGECALFAVRTTEAGRLDVKQSAVAVRGSLLANWGDDDPASESKRVSLRLEHATCLLGGGLIQMDSGDVPRFLAPIDVTARNNIFATNSTTSLISLLGRTADDEFRRLVRWDGGHNFYDRFAAYWTVGTPSAGTSNMPPLQFDDWKHLLGDRDVDANNSGIVWKHSWQLKPFATLRKDELELASLNQAVSGATDGTDVGADLSLIRRIAESPSPD